jgi:hypothetical protein
VGGVHRRDAHPGPPRLGAARRYRAALGRAPAAGRSFGVVRGHLVAQRGVWSRGPRQWVPGEPSHRRAPHAPRAGEQRRVRRLARRREPAPDRRSVASSGGAAAISGGRIVARARPMAIGGDATRPGRGLRLTPSTSLTCVAPGTRDVSLCLHGPPHHREGQRGPSSCRGGPQCHRSTASPAYGSRGSRSARCGETQSPRRVGRPRRARGATCSSGSRSIRIFLDPGGTPERPRRVRIARSIRGRIRGGGIR